MRTRAGATVALVAAALMLAPGTVPTGGAATHPAPAAATEAPSYRFVSMPDFLNADIADLSGLPLWRPEYQNGTTPEWDTAVATLLDDLAAEQPQAFLLAGDMVEGHWGRDDDGTLLFGPTGTPAERTEAARAAADFYYGQVQQRFAARDLSVYPAIGDHELGDNPWRPPGTDPDHDAWYRWKHDHLGALRQAWARWFTDSGARFARRPDGTPYAGTAYAVKLAPEVLLVTVDEYSRRPRTVAVQLGDGELTWLRGVLARAAAHDVDWVIVQGHNPVLGPVRSVWSSRTYYRGGADSPFWRTLVRYGVDLYLAGEVHATTLRRDHGVVQVSHGGILARGATGYVVGDISGDELRLEAKSWATTTSPLSPPLWSTDAHKRVRWTPTVTPTPRTDGLLVMTSTGVIRRRTGILRPYQP